MEMRLWKSRRVWLLFAGALLSLASSPIGWGRAEAQDAEQSWKLSHDQVAVFDLHDAQKGQSLGEWCLLGCEVDLGVGVNEPFDLAYRFLIRSSQRRAKPGEIRKIEEDVFNRAIGRSSAPLKMLGGFRYQALKTVKLGDVFRGLRGNKNLPKEPIEVYLVEGQFDVVPYRVVDQATILEKKSTATLTTLAAIRSSDGAIVAGRYAWQGVVTRFGSFEARPVRVATAVELLLKRPPQAMTFEALRGRIEESILRGSAWLKGKQEVTGRFADMASYWGISRTDTGSTSLSTMALLHSGLPSGDRQVSSGLAYATQFKHAQAYSVAALIMAIEAKYLPLRTFEDLQNYDEGKVRKSLIGSLTKRDADLVNDAARWLIDSQTSGGGWGYDGTDNLPNVSIVQYALLGLKSASRVGATIAPNVWKQAALYLLSGMQRGGQDASVKVTRLGGTEEELSGRPCAWGYYAGKEYQTWPETTTTMTLAALAALAICDSELEHSGSEGNLRAQIQDAIRGGTIMLTKHYGARSSQPEGAWIGNAMTFYYLYSLERAGVFLNIQKFGDHDWFLEGASLLLSEQKPDGRWESGFEIPIVDTSFALLYLKRATVPVRTSAAVATKAARERQNESGEPKEK